jgi:hypothetical protein
MARDQFSGHGLSLVQLHYSLSARKPSLALLNPVAAQISVNTALNTPVVLPPNSSFVAQTPCSSHGRYNALACRRNSSHLDTAPRREEKNAQTHAHCSRAIRDQPAACSATDGRKIDDHLLNQIRMYANET